MYYVFLVLMNPLMGSHSVFSHSSMSWDHNLTLINWEFYFEGQEVAFGMDVTLKVLCSGRNCHRMTKVNVNYVVHK